MNHPSIHPSIVISASLNAQRGTVSGEALSGALVPIRKSQTIESIYRRTALKIALELCLTAQEHHAQICHEVCWCILKNSWGKASEILNQLAIDCSADEWSINALCLASYCDGKAAFFNRNGHSSI